MTNYNTAGDNLFTFEEVQKDQIDFSKYINVTKAGIPGLEAFLHEIPYIANAAALNKNLKGAYRVGYDKGLGTLQKSAKTPGAFRAVVVGKNGNNDIKGAAELFEIGSDGALKAGQAALAVFTALSVATSQYFLARIDRKLTSIEGSIRKIEDLLYLDKQTSSAADAEYLADTLKQIEFIENSGIHTQSVLTEVIGTRRRSDASIRFYSAQINGIEQSLSQKDKLEDVDKKIDEIKRFLPEYYTAVCNYCISYYIEARLSGQTDGQYFEIVKENMKQRIEAFSRFKEHYN